MFRIVSVVLPLFVVVALVSQFGTSGVEHAVAGDPDPSTPTIDSASPGRSQQPKPSSDVLVTVNGTPLSEVDVDFALRGGHGNERAVPRRKDILERIVEQELAGQRAIELGLDADPDFQKKLRRIEAQLNAFKRRELSKLLIRHEIAERAEVSEQEAKRYFVENAKRIRTELHVWQILERDEDLAKQALSDIRHGASFEDVVKRRFKNLPKTVGEPWDLGYLKWTQVPKPWRSVVYDLRKGEVSGVIRGPNRRFWIIKLVDQRENPDTTFESMKPVIIGHLKSARIEKLRETTRRDLRANAKIVYAERAFRKNGTISVPTTALRAKTPSKR